MVKEGGEGLLSAVLSSLSSPSAGIVEKVSISVTRVKSPLVEYSS